MNVLIGCERSGIVRRAFRGYGHNAWSCDLEPAEDHHLTVGNPYHYQDDIFNILGLLPWDLIILHPECTYMAVSGNRWYAGTPQRTEAIKRTQHLWEVACDTGARVCLEQPITTLKLPCVDTQIIQPWQFGHPTTKATKLHLHKLPKLEPTDIVEPTENRVWKMAPSPTRSIDRARTYPGIAEAFASQWGKL